MAGSADNDAHGTQSWFDLTRFSIAQRITGLSCILFGILLVSGFMFVKDLRETAQRTQDTKIKIRTQESASAAHTEFGNLRYWLTDLSVSLLMNSEQNALGAWERFKTHIDEIAPYAPEVAKTAKKDAENYRLKALEAADAFTDKKRVIGNALLVEARTHSDAVDKALDDLVSRLNTEVLSDQSATVRQAAMAENTATVALMVIVGLGMLMTYLVLRSIVGPLRRVDAAMSAVSKGQFDIDVPRESSDEIGRMAGTLRLLRDSQLELEKARQEAEAANSTKSQFLASMSHELRTPLNAIIGYSEMLSEDAHDSGQLESIPDLEKILSAGKHLLSLINDILDLSKIEAGKMEIFVESFDLAEALEGVSSTVKPLTQNKSNRFITDVQGPIGQMTTDLTKLRQILFNLLSNAAKFTENGTITLTVSPKCNDGQDLIEFAVRDTGIGLSQEQIGKLFQAFTQAEASTTRKYGGTGLGLALSRHFCEMLGGTISVESKPGEGSTFLVVLPRVLSDATQSPSAGTNSSPDASARKILVVDDDDAARTTMAQAIEGAGYIVEQARDGRECLETVRTFQPHAIVLDIIMPRLDGWNVLRSLKEDPEHCEIPVILASVLADKDMGYVFGAVEYLMKPFDQSQLISTLRSVCDESEPRDVLIIDDDKSARELSRRILSKLGWRIFEAANGKKGLESMSRHKPALVLLDLMMPEKNGFEVLQDMQDDPELKDVPVIIMTSKSLDKEEISWLNRHASDLVHKGTTGRIDLIKAIETHLTS